MFVKKGPYRKGVCDYDLKGKNYGQFPRSFMVKNACPKKYKPRSRAGCDFDKLDRVMIYGFDYLSWKARELVEKRKKGKLSL